MAYAAPLLQSINSGEFSARMEARVDFDRYPNAAKRLRNTVLLPQGGWMRRSGSRFVCEVADSDDETIGIPFQVSQEQSYFLEGGDGYFRFFRRQARIEVDDTDAAISNGTFASDISGWTDLSDAPTYPAIIYSATGVATAGSVTATVPLSTSAVGHLLLMFITVVGGTALTITTPSGWTQLFHVLGSSSLRRFACYYKTAVGGEGSSVDVTISSSDQRWTSVCHTISGFQGAPEAATATGSSTAPNPGSLTPSWGSAKSLWIAAFGEDNNASVTTKPTDFSGLVAKINSSTYQSTTASTYAGIEVATENPSAYAVSSSGDWVSATVAIRPATASILWDTINSRMQLPAPVTGSVIAQQTVAVTGTFKDNEHVLTFTVAAIGLATVKFRVGSTSGGAEILTEMELGAGEHSIAFTPGTTTFYVQFINTSAQSVWIDNVAFLDDEPMSLVSPYTPDDWASLRAYQGTGVAYLLHPDHPVRALSRYGHRSWSLTDAFYKDGPYGSANEGFDYLARQAVSNPLFENGIDGWTDASTGDGYVDHQDDTKLAELDPGTSSGSGVAILRTSAVVAVGVVITVHFLLAGAGPVTVKMGTSAGDTTYLTASYAAGWSSFTLTSTAAQLHVEFNYSENSQERAAVGGFLVYPQAARLIQPNGLTGEVSITAYGFTPFKSTDVGRLLRMVWPGHEPGYGVITAYTSSTAVTVQVVRAFGALAPTAEWYLGSWCEERGYPATLGKFDGRTVLANNALDPGRLWPSQSNDPLDMRPDSYVEGAITVEDDDAISRALDGEQIDPIQWMNGKQQLVVGTAGGQWIVGSSGAVITPADMSAKQHSAAAGGNVKAVAVEEITIYADRSLRALYEIGFKFDDNSFVSSDLTILADHILRSPVQQLVYQRRPFSTIWARRTDGRVALLAYNREHQVLGWTLATIGGTYDDGNAVIESMATVPGADDDDQFYPSDERDEVWMIVKRTINGVTKRYVEFLEYAFEGPLREDYATEALWRAAVTEAQEDAFYVDCGLTYDGSAATVISGLGHLEGETVKAVADGRYVGEFTVSGGAITLAAAASKVHVGLGYFHEYESLKIPAGSRAGTPVNKVKGITSVGLLLLDCTSFTIQTVEYSEQSGRRMLPEQTVQFRRPQEDPVAAVPLFTGETSVNTPQASSTDPRIYINSDLPLPFTLLGLAPVIDGTDRPAARR